jgi:hypothetical protein
LELHDVGDRSVFDGTEFGRGDLAAGVLRARGHEWLGPEKAADVIRTEGRRFVRAHD